MTVHARPAPDGATVQPKSHQVASNGATNSSKDSSLTIKNVYLFGPGISEGDKTMNLLLGGKGANLGEMCRIGLRVPPGFTISTNSCAAFHSKGGNLSDDVWHETLQALHKIEEMMGARLGDASSVLLLSVRSGAAVSMPGMMDTVLNLGLNDAVVEALAAKTDARFAWDSYRRFIDLFASVVLGVEHDEFEKHMSTLKDERGVSNDIDLDADAFKELVARYKSVYAQHGHVFPDNPCEQLRQAIVAVFRSWQAPRAVAYRELNGIHGLAGTAVNVQAMVFGNMGNTSGTGVLFTRSPATGENKLYGEYLVNAQGEDVVAGIRTPEPIAQLEQDMPHVYKELLHNCSILEHEFQDMQDIEFTVQQGTLWMLQCRTGKRTGQAAVVIARAFVAEGLTTEERAVAKMVEPRHLDQLMHPQFADPEKYKANVLGKGLPASPGAAVGKIAFDSRTAEALAAKGTSVILLRRETSPEDVKGMHSAAGVLTQLGGMTSHAAVVARGWGKTCVTGCAGLAFDRAAGTVTLGGVTLKQGDEISLNGSTGEVIRGAAEVAPPHMTGDVGVFMEWVARFQKLGVKANADSPEDAALAHEHGAQGIGLVRTEHMFFATSERIRAVRRMIFARDTDERAAALKPIEDFQAHDLQGIFEAMAGMPVTIRLLDPPLHEFLPHSDNAVALQHLAEDVGMGLEEVAASVARMREVNPMLGFRGCRLGIMYPEVTRMQVRAVFQAAAAAKQAGADAQPEIMVPLVATVAELRNQIALIHEVAKDCAVDLNVSVEYRVGTMIETPRSALIAQQLAKDVDFFSFGTNDLTQMAYGLSRDDIGHFLPTYMREKILPADPFQVLDQEGVGALIKMAVQGGRAGKAGLQVGLCGEQGADASSVAFCARAGLDYVSCSPLRVPVARLAAAQAALAAEH